MKKMIVLLMLMLIMAFAQMVWADTTQSFSAETGSFLDGSDSVEMSYETIEMPDIVVDDTSPGTFLKSLLNQIINLVLYALLGLLAIYLKRQWNIIITIPNIERKIRKQVELAESYTVQGKARIPIIKNELLSTLKQKEKSLITKVWGSIDDAIYDSFKKFIKPDRLYKLVKGLVR